MMRPQLRRLLGVAMVFVLATSGLLATFASTAEAQAAVVGTADFRNAPQLVPGSYTDRLVTGDSAWYSVIYSNGTPFDFEVSIAGNAPVGTELTASFVAPNFAIAAGPDPSISGPGVVYPAGHTNLWFLKVSLESSGQIGVEYPVTITVNGVQAVGVDDCAETPGCTLEAEHDVLAAALAEAESELQAIGSLETEAGVASEIQNLQGFADTSAALLPGVEGRLGEREATMAQLCAPDPMCETFPNPSPTTPMIGWLVGIAALLLGAYAAVKKLSISTDADTVDAAKEAPRAPSALEKARRESAAKKKADKKASKKRS